MRYGKSNSSRYVVARLDYGDQLPDTLIAICEQNRVHAGRIHVQGTLREVELQLFDPEQRTYRPTFVSEGPVELIQLTGMVSTLGGQTVINAHAIVAYLAHGQSGMAAGTLSNAAVHAAECVIEVFDDLRLERSLDKDAGLPVIKGFTTVAPRNQAAASVGAPSRDGELEEYDEEDSDADLEEDDDDVGADDWTGHDAPVGFNARAAGGDRPAAQRSSSAPAASSSRPVGFGGGGTPPLELQKAAPPRRASWQAALDTAKDLDDELDDDEPVELRRGDLLLHPRLGDCIVESVVDDSAVNIRLPATRRVSKLALGLLKIERAPDRDGRRVFKVTAPGRG
jgi:predicted DNA-binding protein with PD1-like motif